MNPPAALAPAPTKPRVLVVDDEEIVLAALRETLLRAGYEVCAVPDAHMALDHLQITSFAVIISDHQMPRMTGLEFLARAKNIQPDASRLLITAVLTLGTVIEAINSGEIYRFVVKPWLREELLATVRNAVQRHELLHRNAELLAASQSCNARLAATNESLAAQVRLAEAQRAGLRGQLAAQAEITLRALEATHPLLGCRARRAGELATALAASLTLTQEDADSLKLAAWFHDLGLLTVPHEIVRRWLQQPAEVTEDERALLQQHPVTGAELLGPAPELAAAAAAIRAHHEHYDGTGWPDGLAELTIPPLARLLAVVAAFADAAEGDGPAAEQLRHASGAQFDPEAVRALLRLLPTHSSHPRARQVLLAELQPGMVSANAIYTARGLLLVPEGQPLNELIIGKLLSHHQTAPITQSLLVYG